MPLHILDYERIKQFWNKRALQAGKIDPRALTLFCNDQEVLDFREKSEKALFDQHVSFTGTEKVLEVGAGEGSWTLHFVERCQQLVVSDIAEKMLKINEERIKKAGYTNVRFCIADLRKLALLEKDFDITICFGVSIYLNDDDLVGCYKRIRKHLKNQGLLFCRDHLTSGERIENIDVYADTFEGSYSCIYRPKIELDAVISKAGFKNLWQVPIYPPDEASSPAKEGKQSWFSGWQAI